MLKNGRLKICESVPSAIGETRPRNTRNKTPAMFQRFSTSVPSPLHPSWGRARLFPSPTPRCWVRGGRGRVRGNIFFLHLRIFLILSPAWFTQAGETDGNAFNLGLPLGGAIYLVGEFFNVYRKFPASSVVYLETIVHFTFLENIRMYCSIM